MLNLKKKGGMVIYDNERRNLNTLQSTLNHCIPKALDHQLRRGNQPKTVNPIAHSNSSHSLSHSLRSRDGGRRRRRRSGGGRWKQNGDTRSAVVDNDLQLLSLLLQFVDNNLQNLNYFAKHAKSSCENPIFINGKLR